jgi:general secretion pathway protein B
MSILLEALRKSERKQRPHETPTIHSEVQSGSAAGSLRILPMSMLLIIALLLTGWFVWRQYRVSGEGYQPPVTLAADKVHRVARPVAAEQGATNNAAKPPAPAVNKQKRTPVESYESPVESKAAPEIAAIASAADKQPQAASAEGNPNSATVQAPSSAPPSKSPASQRERPAAGNRTAAASKPDTTGKDIQTAKEVFHPGEPEPIGYWELPDSVRADVPVIKFSVLVYAANPADRFVLVNGQRLGEGDTLKPGLVVKEIRREGVVFSYRLYQFLVDR